MDARSVAGDTFGVEHLRREQVDAILGVTSFENDCCASNWFWQVSVLSTNCHAGRLHVGYHAIACCLRGPNCVHAAAPHSRCKNGFKVNLGGTSRCLRTELDETPNWEKYDFAQFWQDMERICSDMSMKLDLCVPSTFVIPVHIMAANHWVRSLSLALRLPFVPEY